MALNKGTSRDFNEMNKERYQEKPQKQVNPIPLHQEKKSGQKFQKKGKK